MALFLNSFLIFSSFCFTPDENAPKEVVPKEIQEMRDLLKGEGTIVEVTFKTDKRTFKKILANCIIKDGKLTGQIVKTFDKEFFLTSARISYMLDIVDSIKVFKKGKIKKKP